MKEKCVLVKCGRIAVALSFTMLALVSEAKLKTVWGVDDYIQDGLIANYDGIMNAGKDNPRESIKAEWVDIVGGGVAKLKTVDSTKDLGKWLDNGYDFQGYSYFQTASKLVLGNEFTIQLVTDTELGFIDEDHDYPTLWGSGGGFNIYLNRSYDKQIALTNIFWKEDAYCDGNTTRPYFPWEGKYISAAFDAQYSYLTQTPNWSTAKNYRLERTKPASVGELTYTWGGRSGDNGVNCSKGIIYAWRAYSRKLSDSELMWNNAVDEIRFRGANILPVTNVVVEAGMWGLTGVESAGIYMVEGEHVFTAENVTQCGNVYEPIGYSVSEWDETDKIWGHSVTYNGKSYKYVASQSSPKVRIVWLWKLVSGIERVDVCHYVQDGLIANYDAIRNMGIGNSHDSSKDEWVNLIGNDKAILRKTVSWKDEGGWVDSGYSFMGHSYFETETRIKLGDGFTIQVVSDTEMSHIDDEHEYPNIWSSGEFGIYLNRSAENYISATNLYWKEDSYTGDGTRPHFHWDGKYINAAFDASYSYMVQTPHWIDKAYNRVKITEKGDVGALKYSWGGRYASSNTSKYCSKGIIHAWRAYSRKLTDIELAWNREIDEIRFRKASPMTISNAVEVVSLHDTFKSKEDGIYLLGGSHTFIAEKKVKEGITYAPKFEVQSWNGNTSAWEISNSGSGNSCTLQQSESTVPRRIVWKWFKEGFSVIVR